MAREVFAPARGLVIDITRVKDPVFSQKMMGDGFAVIPCEGKIVSPVSGTITMMFPTCHAFGVTTDDGFEILVHIGIDTVEEKGQGFTPLKQQGDRVEQGELVVKMDLDYIASKHDTSVICILTNQNDFPETKISIANNGGPIVKY